jgi:hypothetical protein
MADVDMTDVPSGSVAPVKRAAGKAKAGGAADADGKKRFEVKKVRHWLRAGLINSSNCNNSGTQWHYGLGISSLTTAQSAEIISWIFVRCLGFSY